MRCHYLGLVFALALAGCSQGHENTGEACLVAKQLICECMEVGVTCDPSRIPWYDHVYGMSSCTGNYPAADDYQVEAMLHIGGGGYTVDEGCEVEIIGDHHLLVSSRFRERPQVDDIFLQPLIVSCPVPPSTPGRGRSSMATV